MRCCSTHHPADHGRCYEIPGSGHLPRNKLKFCNTFTGWHIDLGSQVAVVRPLHQHTYLKTKGGKMDEKGCLKRLAC